MIVIDASVALKWVLDEPGFEAARALRTQSMVAPEFWIVECANALWKIARRGELEPALALDKLNILRAAPVRMHECGRDIEAALEIAQDLDHPVYDCLYIALARREGVSMVTADRPFFMKASASPRLSRFVRLLGGSVEAGA